MPLSAPQIRVDPLAAYNFTISLVDSSSVLSTVLSAVQLVTLAGFSECSGLEGTLDMEEYAEGGRNGGMLRFPTRVKWSNLRLRRGVALSDDLWSWHAGFVEGHGKRRDGVIVLQDEQHLPLKAWVFYRGLPAKWNGPSLDAVQNRTAIEELEIAHEGLTLVAAASLAMGAAAALL